MRGSSVEAGIGLTIGLMPGAGTSLNLSLGGGRERADSTLVNRQTSIIADERLDARIEGHTQLDGGLIASRDGDLTLDTGTFGYSDITERARSDTRRATLNLGFGDGGSPSIGIEGELAHAATDAITRATVGEGEITIRDEDAQRAREEAGETRDVAALNRDLDAARETLRDERAGVRFYASDSSVRELASGFAETRANIAAAAEILSKALEALSSEDRALVEEIEEKLDPEADLAERAEAYADDLVERGEVSEEDRDEAAALFEAAAIEAAGDPAAAAQLNACMAPGRQGFNLHDLIFPSAHAQRSLAPAMSPAGGQGAAAIGQLGQQISGAVDRACNFAREHAPGLFIPLAIALGVKEAVHGDRGGDTEIASVTGESGRTIRIIADSLAPGFATLEGVDAEGRPVSFFIRQRPDGEYDLIGASRIEGGVRQNLSPRQALDLTRELFGPVGGASNVFVDADTTVITPHDFQLPRIFVLPMADDSGRPGPGHNNPPPDQRLGPEDYQTGPGGPDGPQTPRPPVGAVVVGGTILGQNWTQGNPAQADFNAWTSTFRSSSQDNAQRHFNDHGADFGSQNVAEYVRSAINFTRNPPEGILMRTRPTGDRLMFHERSNTFAVVNSNGQIRTFYKPAPRSPENPRGFNQSQYKSSLEYFLRQ